MPNILVPATAEGMPKFDKRLIMQRAWEKYRAFRKSYGAWQIERGIVDASFSNCLRISWRIAKKEAADAAAAAKAKAAYGERAADRVHQLTAELMRLDCKPWGMRSHRVADARQAMRQELAVLANVTQ